MSTRARSSKENAGGTPPAGVSTHGELLIGQEPVELKAAADGDLELYSVTTIIKVLGKEALIHWSAQEAARCAIKHQEAWKSIEESSGTAEAVKWIAGARFRAPKGEKMANELGTAFHAAADKYHVTGIRPTMDDDVAVLFNHWDAWLQRFQPTFLASEMTVYSPSYQYAGTSDGIFIVNGVPCIFDLKTSKNDETSGGKEKGVYPEIALQLAAYRHAEFAAVWRPRRYEHSRRRLYLLAQAERDRAVRLPPVEAGLGILVTPEGCRAYPVLCDEPVFEAFLFTKECFRWTNDLANRLIGPELLTPERAAA